MTSLTKNLCSSDIINDSEDSRDLRESRALRASSQPFMSLRPGVSRLTEAVKVGASRLSK